MATVKWNMLLYINEFDFAIALQVIGVFIRYFQMID